MRTFSEIIDIVVATAKVPHLLPFVVMTANGILRDLHTNHPSDYDLAEAKLLPMNYDTAAQGCTPCATHVAWKIPCEYRAMRAVRYNGCEFVPNKKPGLVQKSAKHFWYQSGDTIIFSGAPQAIDLAFYTQPRSMLYYDVKLRKIKSDEQCCYVVRQKTGLCEPTTPPAEPDPATLWMPYLSSVPAHERIYNSQVTWVIREYYEVIADGTLSRVLNSLGDTTRGGRYYQSYAQGKAMISRTRLHNLEAEL